MLTVFGFTTLHNSTMSLPCGVQEFPNIRFRAAKPGEDASSGLEARSLVAQRVAVDLNERLSLMQRNGQLPASSTCDLIIFDRLASACLGLHIACGW